MDLDTKSKKFNYSLGLKITAAVLAIILAAASAALIFSSVNAADFYNDASLLVEKKKSSGSYDYSDSEAFINRFGLDIGYVSKYYTYDPSIEKYMLSEQSKVEQSGKKAYSAAEKKWNNSENADGSTFDFNYTLKFKGVDYQFQMTCDAEEDSSIFLNELKEQYSDFVAERSGSVEYKDAAYGVKSFKNFKYCILSADGKTVYSNLPLKTAKSTILSYGKYYASLGGVVSTIGYTSFNAVSGQSACSSKLYAYFAVDPKLGGNDTYSRINNYSQSIKNTNICAQFVCGVSAALAAFALAIFVISNCGRKNNYDGVKPAFIDYVPLDLHLAVAASLIVCGIALTSQVASNCADQGYSGATQTALFIYVFAVLASACFAVLFEFICSLVRIIKAKRKPFWKNFLILQFFHLIGKGISAIFKKISAALSYNPKNYKKNLIKTSVLYFAASFILLVLDVFASRKGTAAAVLIFTVLLIALNAAVVIKAVKYLIWLDKIITAAKERKNIEMSLEKLPESLKTLAQSMKYSNEELSAAVSKAVKDERLKAELITNVSHDLKTPLTSIITYVDLLSKCDIDDENAKKYIAVLDEKGAKLKRLIEDLIEASKVSSGNITLSLSRLDLAELSAQAVGESTEEFEKAGLNLIFETPQNSVEIFADGSKTFRIMQNLLSNARKYSAVASRVYVRAYKENESGVFEIKNISAEQLNISPEELTERFVRGDKSRTKQGNGLGLSIAKELCLAQSGKLEISIDGDLFKVRVILPEKGAESGS